VLYILINMLRQSYICRVFLASFIRFQLPIVICWFWMAASEEEIYSIMFTSLKHPVRRKILRMLNDKPLTFMEMVDNLGVSSSHLTYHLESLGELILKWKMASISCPLSG
jgi:hypothetical protein